MQSIDTQVLFKPDSAKLRFLPEGPYAVDDGHFSWVAIQHGPESKVGSLNIFDYAARKNTSHPLPGRPGFAFPTTDPKRFIVGVERQLLLYNVETDSSEVLCEGVDADVENTIINDAAVVGDAVVFGTKELTFSKPHAGLYLFRMSDRRLVKLAGGQTCSNGKAVLSREGRVVKLLDIDTPTRQLACYDLDVDAGTLTNRRVTVDFAAEPGFPDGMILAPDRQSVFVSLYNPDFAEHGQTRQYRLSDGQCVATYRTAGAPQNTCPQLCRLGGRVVLIITTAVEHMPQERQAKSAASGSIFFAETDFASAADCPALPI